VQIWNLLTSNVGADVADVVAEVGQVQEQVEVELDLHLKNCIDGIH